MQIKLIMENIINLQNMRYNSTINHQNCELSIFIPFKLHIINTQIVRNWDLYFHLSCTYIFIFLLNLMMAYQAKTRSWTDAGIKYFVMFDSISLWFLL